MRAEPRKATSKSAMAARARMVLTADLGWLEGAPLIAPLSAAGVPWLAVPAYAPAVEMEIGRTHLSRATYALNKLRGEHAAALPSLAGEPEVWLASVERRLELLKRAVHHGEAPPADLSAEPFVPPGLRRRAAALAAAEPVLDGLLATLSWLHAGHPGRLRAACSAIATIGDIAGWGRGASLLAARLGAQDSLVLLIRLIQLAMDHGKEKVEPLAAALFDERVHETPLGQEQTCVQILRAISRRPKVPLPEELPGGTLERGLAAWCEKLVQHNHRARQQALRLFALATPVPFVARWADWWRQTRELLREARALLATPYLRESRHALRARLVKHQKAAPPEFQAERLGYSLGSALSAPPAVTDRLAAALGLIPAEAKEPGRLQVFSYWIDLWQPTLLEGFLHYLKRRPAAGEALLGPWRDIAAFPRTRYGYSVEDELVDRRMSRGGVLAAYDFLAEVVSGHGGLEPEAARQAVELYVLSGDAGLAARALASLLAHGQAGDYFPAEALVAALRLCREHPDGFAGVLAALNKRSGQGGLGPADWPESALAVLSAGDLGAMARQAIVNRQLDRLLTCGVKAMLLDAAEIRPLPAVPVTPETAPAWVTRYPEPLQPVLRRIAAVIAEDDAESRVARWLGDDLPNPRQLEREIAALTTKLAAGGAPELAVRLASLRERLAHPAVPAPARLERLAAKLDRAWGRAVLENWERELDRRLPVALERLLGLGAEPPAWLLEPHNLELLAAATRLTGARRRLACRLFRLRCGPPPWDLRDAPENRRFVEGLPALDWAPWIDGIGSVEMTADDGRRLFLALEDDPLEIFRMGGHFQTCLSPGAFNYYSVFANAADINKRVLYARDAPGASGRASRIVGRCLLAITAYGELLTFGPYCHDGKLDFERLCADFAGRLAHRMGAQRAVQGAVPTLVAPAWYDDGPQDLGGLHPALQKGSPLRARLASLAPAELLGELRRALKPARLDQATLPRVIALPELAARPELAVPLLRPVAECRAFPEAPLATVARLAFQAGAGDLVRHLLGRPLAERLRRELGTQPGSIPCCSTSFSGSTRPASSPSCARRAAGPSTAGWTRPTPTAWSTPRPPSPPSTGRARHASSGSVSPPATPWPPRSSTGSARSSTWTRMPERHFDTTESTQRSSGCSTGEQCK
jgi:hypothetical protein